MSGSCVGYPLQCLSLMMCNIRLTCRVSSPLSLFNDLQYQAHVSGILSNVSQMIEALADKVGGLHIGSIQDSCAYFPEKHNVMFRNKRSQAFLRVSIMFFYISSIWTMYIHTQVAIHRFAIGSLVVGQSSSSPFQSWISTPAHEY